MNKPESAAGVRDSAPRTVADCLAAASRQLAATLGLEVREARLEARVLAAYAWRVAPAWLIAHDTDPVDEARGTAFDDLVSRRASGVPIAYLVGRREFYGRVFEVSPEVLIPRPDTELLVERALERMPSDRGVDVLDLGTGSGCIAITLALERPAARVTALDRSAAALAVAQRNATRLGGSVEWRSGDWFGGLDARHFDVIVSNPPYVAEADTHLRRGDVRFEPPGALAAGPDGLADLRRICAAAPGHLNAGGWLLLEHGYDQGVQVRALLETAGFGSVETWRDLGGQPRVSGGQWLG